MNWLFIRWPKFWSFSISSSNEYSGLISFRMGWFDLLAVQGMLKSLLQHHSLKASVLWCSASFVVQLSYPYRTTGKTIALTMQTFLSKVSWYLWTVGSHESGTLVTQEDLGLLPWASSKCLDGRGLSEGSVSSSRWWAQQESLVSRHLLTSVIL